MKSNRLLRIILILLTLTLNIGCDQVSKSIVRQKLIEGSPIQFLSNHFILIKEENKGAFLSAGDSLSGPLRLIILNLIPLAAILFGLGFILTKANLHRVTLLGVILIVGGGAGNLYDRMVHGSVTDFMFIDFGIFHTGVFNVADMSIMAGMFIILIDSFMQKKEHAKQV
jgi:signal peptidase II